MKKMISILAVAAALSFVSCKKKTDDAAASGSAPANGAAGDDKVPAPAPATGSAAAGGGGAAGSTGSPECDEYLKTFDDVVAKCKDKLGPALDAMKQSRDAQAEAFKQWSSLEGAAKKAAVEAAATGCKSATDAVKQSATSMGCTL